MTAMETLFQRCLYVGLCFHLIITTCSAVPIREDELGHFREKCEIYTKAGNIPVRVYKSSVTGLHVIHAKIPGPTVSGYFTLATEAQSDDGLPHTLEHLVFLGSEKYPYNGVLDLVANRCFASGTNAWTDVDHTAYTLRTGGSQGFVNILPVFLDHLLYPTLNASAFTTEVHHITAQGNDAGVVYSEMQARENKGGERGYRERIKALYPEPSGYRYQTGGLLANLRQSTNLEKIKAYHKKYYRPENLFVIVIGNINLPELFGSLEPIEQKIESKGLRGSFTRPWQLPVPPLLEDVDKQIEYSSTKEDNGMVFFGWRGPSALTEILELQSLRILLSYLSYSSISILHKTFVEMEKPYASGVYGYVIENSYSALFIDFYGVPVNKTKLIKPLLMSTLKTLDRNSSLFDLEKLHSVIHNLLLNERNKLESSPQSSFSSLIINYVLHGSSCEYLDLQLNKKIWMKELLRKPKSYWLDLVQRYFLEVPSVVVRAVPSKAELARLEEAKKKRIKERKELLGEEGLKEWGVKVKNATKANKTPPPDSLVRSFPIPTVNGISFHSLQAYTNIANYTTPTNSIYKLPNGTVINLNDFPVRTQLNDVNSEFVEFTVILSTRSLSFQQRFYIPIFLELLLQSSIQNGTETIPHEKVIKQLIADTLKVSCYSFRYYGPNLAVYMKVDIAKYPQGVKWLQNILHNVRFTEDRIKVKAKQYLNTIKDTKKSATSRLSLIYYAYIYGNDSNRIFDRQRSHEYAKLYQKIKLVPLDNVNYHIPHRTSSPSLWIAVYKNMTQPDKITVHMSTNVTLLASQYNFTAPWSNFISCKKKTNDNRMYVWPDALYVRKFNETNNFTGYIIGMDALSSSYIQQVTHTISNYSHPDLPALMVATNYLSQTQGPMYKVIRGKGLAYSFYLYFIAAEGLMDLYILKSAQPLRAYTQAILTLNRYLNGTETWDPLLLESAKSSLIYEIISREDQIPSLIYQSLLSYYRKVPSQYNKQLIEKVNNVTLEQARNAAVKYLSPLLDAKKSRLFVVCPKSKMAAIQTGLAKLNQNLTETSYGE